jgi:hypothetical protein
MASPLYDVDARNKSGHDAAGDLTFAPMRLRGHKPPDLGEAHKTAPNPLKTRSRRNAPAAYPSAFRICGSSVDFSVSSVSGPTNL